MLAHVMLDVIPLLHLGQNTSDLASPANYFFCKHSKILDFFLNDGKIIQKYFFIDEFFVSVVPLHVYV